MNVEESKYLRMCKQLEELIPKIHECHSDTKKFLRVGEIQKMAEMFGVPKGELDTWAQMCSGQVMSAQSKCPQCSAENRAGAKFCIKCGGKLMP